MLKNLKIATRLGVGFGAVALLLVILSIVSVMRLATLNDGTKLIMEDRYPKVMLSNEVIRLTLDNARQLGGRAIANRTYVSETELGEAHFAKF